MAESTLIDIGTSPSATYASGTTFRYVIPPSLLLATGQRIRIHFRWLGVAYTVYMTVGLQATSGDAWDIDPGTFQWVTKGGSATISITADEQVSDYITLPVDGTRAVVVAYYGVAGLIPRMSVTTADIGYYRRSSGNYVSPADQSGFTSLSSYVHVLRSITIADEALRIASQLDQSWGLFSDHLQSPLIQSWHLMADVLKSELSQPWGLRTAAEHSQRWLAAGKVKGILSQPWKGDTTIAAALSQRWQCMIRLKTIFHQAWSSPESLSTSLNQRYTLTEQKLRTVFDNSYDEIKNTGIVNTSLHQQYWVTGNTSVKTLSTQYLVVSGTVVYPLSIDIKSSIDQYAITASIELATYKDMQEFLSGVQVEVCGVLNENFVLIVDTYDYDLSFDSDTFKVDLISPAALLDSPFAALINSDYTGMASEICKILAGSITVYWNILDWYIGEGILSASEETPLSVIRKIVNAVGGVIQSLPDGSITIISRYPKSCNTWFSQPIVYSINYSEDVISEQFTLENAPGYNSFSIQDDNTSSTLLRVEVEEIDSNSKTIKVFVYPDVEPLVSHSGNTGTVSLNYTGYITENVDEEVEFVSGESSVNGPISGINYSYWKYSDLGSVTYEPTGVLYSAVTSESLLDISYKTGYYSYTVSTSVLENIQIIVEADV